MGIAILEPNVRGSTGYGKAFTKLDNGFLREGSYKDVNALIDWITTQPNSGFGPDRSDGRQLWRSHDASSLDVLQ